MKVFEKPVLVTRPFFPGLEEFKTGCEEIWRNQWLTNNGPMLQRFHSRLADYLDVPGENMALFVNGTVALEAGYHIMGLGGGDVITTPFTFVATSHALKRIGATPVFADVDPETMCLDPRKAEKLITSRTRAIVPVHVYGNLCDTAAFEELSRKYGIPVIYDAAHAFGCEVQGKTVATCGAMSMFSFHPTKLFHSCEGGLLVFKDAALQQRLFDLRNFAIKSETECTDVGLNGKMNELQALMGCLCLDHIDSLLAYRRRIYDAYAEVFDSAAGTSGRPAVSMVPHSANKAYVPVLFRDSATREKVYEGLKACNVFSRRYFYPLLTDFAPYLYGRSTCPVAEDLASRVLTLPTYYGLPVEDVRAIAKNVLEIANG